MKSFCSTGGAADAASDEKPIPSTVQPPSPEKMQDLTRKTGDSSLYMYYFRTVDFKDASLFMLTSIAVLLGITIFPPVWLKLWTDDNGEYIVKYISVYVVISLFSSAMVGCSIW